MELIKKTHNNAKELKFANLKYSNYLGEKDLSLLRSLRDDNNLIKKKIINIENKLQTISSADFGLMKNTSINPNKQQYNKSNLIMKKKLENQTNHISFDAEKNLSKNESMINMENNEPSKLIMINNQDENSFRLLSARSRTSSCLTRASSATSLENESVCSTVTSNLERILKNLKRYRRSTRRKEEPNKLEILDENDENENHTNAKETFINILPDLTRKNSSNLNITMLPNIYNANKQDLKQKKDKKSKTKIRSKSKSAVISSRKDNDSSHYVHKFYSNSWRIHSEFMQESIDNKKPYDKSQSMFYCVGKKVPETFLFQPDWV